MGERTLLTLTDGQEKVYLYLHWFNVKDCRRAVKETWMNSRNNRQEVAKFVSYFIQDHNDAADIYVVPSGKKSYGEQHTVEINILGLGD